MVTNVVKEVIPNVYRINVPLPNNVLKYVNSYVVKGSDRNLVIDTGMQHPQCLSVVREAMQTLGVDLDRADFFLTHRHPDHMGLVTELAGKNSKVFISIPDGTFARVWDLEELLSWAAEHGCPVADLREDIEQKTSLGFRRDWIGEFTSVRDGDALVIGEYRLECVATPGHTNGHMCLYDRERKVLFSGDHVLGDISPNIVGWDCNWNSLPNYLSSLEKVRTMAVDLVLPGHRSVIRDHRKRIDELKLHHQRRLEEVFELVVRDGGTAYEIASRMTWDWKGGVWPSWPIAQRYFATGEALSHLQYLHQHGMVNVEKSQRMTRFHQAPEVSHLLCLPDLIRG